MKILRWIVGLVFISLFFGLNFFYYHGPFIAKLINILLFSAIFVLYRVVIGPSAADRIVAVDILGVLSIGLLALFGLFFSQGFFMDVGLIWALLSFVASIAFAKILEGRSIDD